MVTVCRRHFHVFPGKYRYTSQCCCCHFASCTKFHQVRWRLIPFYPFWRSKGSRPVVDSSNSSLRDRSITSSVAATVDWQKQQVFDPTGKESSPLHHPAAASPRQPSVRARGHPLIRPGGLIGARRRGKLHYHGGGGVERRTGWFLGADVTIRYYRGMFTGGHRRPRPLTIHFAFGLARDGGDAGPPASSSEFFFLRVHRQSTSGRSLLLESIKKKLCWFFFIEITPPLSP